MKRNFTLAVLLSLIEITAFAQANKSLSNLTNPTSVNQSLIPSSSGSKNLGSPSAGWKDLYLSDIIYLNGGKFINNPISGGHNTAIGWNVLNSVTSSGTDNTGIGYHALFASTDGGGNTAEGSQALSANTLGYNNVANGSWALYLNSTGTSNTANGSSALYSNTEGSVNVANGSAALYFNTTGDGNVAEGSSALYFNTTGSGNTASGYLALGNNTGSENSAYGDIAGYNVTTGSNNTFLGYNANSGSVGAGNNMTAIGNGATVTSSNHIVVGNSSVTSIGGFMNWTNISDGRVKKNIRENVPGLAFINKLQPITYNLDLDAADKIIDQPATKDRNGNIVHPSQQELDARKAKEQIMYTGFIAQDVEKAAQSLNYDFSGVDKPDNENALYGLRYSDFVVPLVKAVQELSVRNDSLKNDNTALHQQINDLISRMNSVEQSLSQCCTSFQSPAKSPAQDFGNSTGQARLEQNSPNPFFKNTTIQFYSPSSASDAMIVVSDLSGKTIQQFDHLPLGNGTVMLVAGALASGTYQYSLLVNGKVIDTKQMVLTK